MALALALGLIADSRFGEVRNVGGTAAAWAHYVEDLKNSRSNLSIGETAVLSRIVGGFGKTWYGLLQFEEIYYKLLGEGWCRQLV